VSQKNAGKVKTGGFAVQKSDGNSASEQAQLSHVQTPKGRMVNITENSGA
jgi:hypothetical protein